jgi:hypothetical protein
VVLEHAGDPGEPDRQSLAFGGRQSIQQLCVLGVKFLPDPPGGRLPVVGELEPIEASIVWLRSRDTHPRSTSPATRRLTMPFSRPSSRASSFSDMRAPAELKVEHPPDCGESDRLS